MRCLLFSLVLGFAGGCAETPLEIPPPSDMARAGFGAVGVLPARLDSSRAASPQRHAEVVRSKGQGAIEGAKSAFEPASEICGDISVMTNGGAIVCLGAAVAGIVAAPVTGIVGAIRTRPASEVEAAEQSLLSGFNRIDPRAALRDQILRAGRSKARITIVAIDEERRDAATRGPTDIDSIMTLFVKPSLLFDDDKVSPAVTLQITVIASVARAKDAVPLHAQMWRYWSREEKFFELADDGARRLEVALANAYERLARKIVHDVFVASAPERQTAKRRGTAWAVDSSTFYYDVATVPSPERPGAR